jgi:putative nucleotidyltransferase with HDIG domain
VHTQEKSKKLKEIVGLVNNSQLSSIKEVVSGIINIINDPRSNVKDLKDIIEVDPPLTAKLLMRANSAYYGSAKKINDIEQAVIWIGLDALKELALSQKVCEIFDKDENIFGYSRVSLWKHSVAVALLGKMIYRREFRETGVNVYVAGLLHDLGIIAEDQLLHKDFKKVLRKSKDEKKNLSKAEDEVLGYNHAEVGKALAENWGFPQELIMAIGYHSHPEVDSEFLKIAQTLYISEYICQKTGYGDVPFREKYFFNKYLQELDIKPYSLRLIFKDFKDEISKMEEKGLF